MQELHIITPVYRPSHMPVIYHSVEESLPGIKKVWWVVFDQTCEREGEEWRQRFMRNTNEDLLINCKVSMLSDPGGLVHRNLMLDEIESEYYLPSDDVWVYFLNDNNTLNPVITKLFEEIDEVKQSPGFLFSTRNKNNGNQCCAEMVYRFNTLGGLRFGENDFQFMSKWMLRNKTFVTIPGEFGYFNELD